MPTEPKKAAGKCYTCLSDDEKLNMQHMKPRVEALRIKREGSGNDNWGYSSQGMVGFGQGGNSSWLDQYDNQNGGFGTYLGGGKTMPDKRQVRTVAVQQQVRTTTISLPRRADKKWQGPVPGMRLLPPGGTQTWPFGPGGTLSNLPSSAGGYSNNSSNVGWGSSASNNVERSNSDSSNGSLGSFANPWANSKSDMGHVGMPGGRLPQGYGNGNFMPQIQTLPQGGSNEAKMREQGFRDRYGSI